MKQSEINGKLNRILNINFSGEMLKMLETILIIFLTIPLYAVLIWSYFYPQESLLWGKRWMYKEEPDISDDAIRYIKVASLISVIGLTLVFIIVILTQFIR